MVTILYRFAQHKGYDVSAVEDTNTLSFNDTLTVSDYAIPAMQWACGSGMVNGIAQEGEMFLAPKDTTTRAQIATLMVRFQGILEMSRNVQSGNTQNLKSPAASDQAAVCACAHSRYFAGGSPSGLRV